MALRLHVVRPSSPRDNRNLSQDSSKPLFTKVSSFWIWLRCCEFVSKCNKHASHMQHDYNLLKNNVKRCFPMWKAALFYALTHQIRLMASTSFFTSIWVYTFSVSVMAPEWPTIILMVVWSIPASARSDIQVWRQQ